jgi:transcriptional regulator of acetoin/glycerol metabolism
MDRSKALTNRPFLNQVRESNRACMIFDNDFVVTFANDQASLLLECNSELLVGISATQEASEDTNANAHMHCFFNALRACLFTAGGHQRLSCDFFNFEIAGSNERWMLLPFNQEQGKQQTLAIQLFHDDPIWKQFAPTNAWQADQHVRDYIFGLQTRQFALRRLLSLAGTNSATKLAAHRTQLAIESKASVLILGSDGVGKTELAEAILFHRNRNHHGTSDITTINCLSLDQATLKEYRDHLTDKLTATKYDPKSTPCVVLDRIDCVSLNVMNDFASFIKQIENCWLVSTSCSEDVRTRFESTAWHAAIDTASSIVINLRKMAQRIDDLPILVRYVLNQIAEERSTTKAIQITDDAMSLLRLYPWPGNIIELRSSLQFAVQQARSAPINIDHLPLAIRTCPSSKLNSKPHTAISLNAAMIEHETRLIEQALDLFPRSKAAAAKYLQISRTKLFRRMSALGLLKEADLAPKVKLQPTKPPEEPQLKKRGTKRLSADELTELATNDIAEETPIFREIHDDE